MQTKETLIRLCNEDFIGSVHNAAKAVEEIITPLCDEITVDSTGSVFGKIHGKSNRKTVMLQAHIDQIGMIVTEITQSGFVKAAAVGGVDIRVLPSQSVNIHCENGLLKGVFISTPPHLCKNSQNEFLPIDETYIDVICENATEKIKPGDYITFDTAPRMLLGDYITSRSLDNRAGCTALILALQMIKQNGKPAYDTVFCFSSAEELGGAGAKTASFALTPDEAIIVDVSFGYSPGCPAGSCKSCGKGSMLGRSPALSKEVTEKIFDIAKAKSIPYQYEIMSGRTGTDADVISISKSGVKCGLISIPLKYMHTPVETVCISDIENCARLLFEYSYIGDKND